MALKRVSSGMPKARISPDPTVARTFAWPDYALIDSGGGRKLERYGRFRVVRPEPQCLWTPRLSEAEWSNADAVFDPTGEEDAGRWRFARPAPESWPLKWRDVAFHGRFTSFRHLAFFPEQAANWEWLEERVRRRPMKVLNLFGYTGVATLAMAAAGTDVTHVDASKKAVAWARENAALSKLDDRPIRWIVEDARKYAAREVKRGNRYDGIVLDPPKYGRGPDGEVWKLYEHLPEMVGLCAQLLSESPSFLLLNAYAERISGVALATLLAEAVGDRGGIVDWGELALMEETGERGVGLSFFARWTA
jgi:23S rRNA (cytosine1962-C5)-methyltransferase